MMTLKAARVNKDLTQKKAASLIGVNVSTLSKWEKGLSCPTNKRIPKILEVYGVSYDELIFLPNNYALSVKTNESTTDPSWGGRMELISTIIVSVWLSCVITDIRTKMHFKQIDKILDEHTENLNEAYMDFLKKFNQKFK